MMLPTDANNTPRVYAMTTLRVSELREKLAQRSDEVAKAILQSIERLPPKMRVSVQTGDLNPKSPTASPPAERSMPTADAETEGGRPRTKK